MDGPGPWKRSNRRETRGKTPPDTGPVEPCACGPGGHAGLAGGIPAGRGRGARPARRGTFGRSGRRRGGVPAVAGAPDPAPAGLAAGRGRARPRQRAGADRRRGPRRARRSRPVATHHGPSPQAVERADPLFRLPRQPHQAAQPADVRRIPETRAGPCQARPADTGLAVRGSRRLQAHQRHARACRRRSSLDRILPTAAPLPARR